MQNLIVMLAAAVLQPTFEVAPVPCETEELAVEVARWDRSPKDSRWVRQVGDKWEGATQRKVDFCRPWRWYFRRTLLRFDGVTADFRLTVNGEAVGTVSGIHPVVEFDVTEALNWLFDDEIEISVSKYRCNSSAPFRSVLAVSTSMSSPRAVKVVSEVSDDLKTAKFRVVDEKGAELKVRELNPPHLWSDEYPAVCLTPIEHRYGWWIFGGIEYRAIKFGLQHRTRRDGRFILNGRPLRLRGAKAHRFTPGRGDNPTTLPRLVRDSVFVKYHNLNAVRAADYPYCADMYELFDRDGIFVLAEEGDPVPPGHPCVLPAKDFQVEWYDLDLDQQALDALKTRLSPVRFSGFDWAKGTLTLENGFTFVDLAKTDGLAWQCLDENGKAVRRGELKDIACAPGERTTVKLGELVGEKVRIEFLKEDDTVVEATYGKAK